jgi:hypothetical protein
MAVLTNPTTVRVNVPPGTTLGAAMNCIGSWLDENKVQPTNFRALGNLGAAFELSFRHEDEARRFVQQFNGAGSPFQPSSA